MTNAEKHTHWWQGLIPRSLITVIIGVVFLGGASSLIISQALNEQERQQAINALNGLVDAVESTANIASFTNDEQLATEVVQGLMRNTDVRRVLIRSGEHVLAHAERQVLSTEKPTTQNPLLITEHAIHGQVIRQLASPFQKDKFIGEIEIYPDWDIIHQRARVNTLITLLLQTGQMALVVIITAGIMFQLVVRPIKKISDRLHNLDETYNSLLEVPKGHENTEIGRLVDDVNDLTRRLVSTLDQERKLQQKQVIEHRKYQDLFDNSVSGIFVTDRKGRLESYNNAFANLIWLPEPSLSGPRYLTEVGWNEPKKLLSMIEESLDKACNTSTKKDDFLLIGRRGDERWIHIAIIYLGDGYIQGTITDVTKRKHEEISAKQLAITDILTGFSNRAGLQHALIDLSPTDPPFALVVIDLNGFKQVNEALGFHIGDQLLLMLSTRLKLVLTPSDHAARIDADEFVLLLKGEHKRESLDQRMEQLLQLLKQPYEVATGANNNPNIITITAKIGIALFPGDGSDLNHLLRSAELALNSSQDNDASSYDYFDPAQQVAVEHRRRLEDDLRCAIDTDEIYLTFQPIVDIKTGKMVGAEALLRWTHPTQGPIFPDVFIPLAEQIGLINQIGIWVLDEACRHVKKWRQNDIDIYVSVNVSAKQIPNGLTSLIVQQTLERYDLPSSAIAIEITEGLLMSNMAVAQSWIESLRTLGIQIYLDDFGTGYSSLAYLKRFPLDTVKIDKSFICDIYTDSSDRALVNAIITMAHSLGLKVVAEGVEDMKQLNALRDMGCGYLQGYFFSRPVKGHEIPTLFVRINANTAHLATTSALNYSI